jgi:hypothetical protein
MSGRVGLAALVVVVANAVSIVATPAVITAGETCAIVGRGDIDCESGSDPSSPVPSRPIGQPQAPSACGPWSNDFVSFGEAFVDVPLTSEINGVTHTLHWRTCNGDYVYSWWRQYTPAEVAAIAYRDLQSGQLPPPTASFAPPLDAMLVNLDTWFAVDEVAPITVRAEVPGLWAQATATPTAIELHTGSQVRQDTTVVECDLWGSIRYAADGCTWTPAYPSVEAATGTDDYRYHGQIMIVWDVTWTSSSGQGGTFNDLRTTTPIEIAVREIQTIGGR